MPDATNVLDSMKHVFSEDDDQIYKLTASKVIGAGKADTANNIKLPVASNDRSLYCRFC
jgi:hypothetical protein